MNESHIVEPTKLLPISEQLAPGDQDELASIVRSCHGDDLAVYPIGGATSLDGGLPAKKPGIGLSLSGLRRVVDYPARDMTVTVEAGMTMKQLADLLAVERQRLPIDVPHAGRATIGGVVATNYNGPRRFGQGTVRDYVIGISAVDGRGMAFKGGGRVVKNVAGYDFCKLLTGSFGTLGVITQLTLKLKPIPERLAVMTCAPSSDDQAESMLAELVRSQTTPVAIEYLSGPGWQGDPAWGGVTPSHLPGGGLLCVVFEGTDAEVRWMLEQLGREWWSAGLSGHHALRDEDATAFVARLIEFSGAGSDAVTIKASVVPSGVMGMIQAFRQVDPQVSIQAHAGTGIVWARLSQAPAGGVTKGLIGKLHSAATAAQGTVVVSSGSLGEVTQQSVWGPLSSPGWLMSSVKREFDPRNILNPGRFVYA